MRDLLIVGGDSHIGRAVSELCRAKGIGCAVTSRRSDAEYRVDLTQNSRAWTLPDSFSHAVVCAGITSLAACESDPAGSRKVNVDATIKLADMLARQGALLMFLSSSRVYPPWIENPSETTPPQPTTEYGRQKLTVEEYLLRQHPSAKIIRPAKIISPDLPLFSDWLRSLSDGKPISAYSDLFLSPVALGVAANSILDFALCEHSGIFHLSAANAMTYLDAARWIAEKHSFNPTLVRPEQAPQPNTPGSATSTCERANALTGFRPQSATRNLEIAFSPDPAVPHAETRMARRGDGFEFK